MSYASISTVSVDTLLGQNEQKVINDFKMAKDTAHRIKQKPIYSTLRGLKNIISDLEMLRNFLEINALQESTSTYGRIEEGIDRIIEYAIEDVNVTMYGDLPKWINSYDTTLKPSRDAMYGIIVDSNKALRYLSEVLLWQSGTGQALIHATFKYESLLSMFQDVSFNMKRVAMTLNDFLAYFDSISRVDPGQFDVVNDTLLPISLVYRKNDTYFCDNTIMDLLNTAGSIFGSIDYFAAKLQDELNRNNHSNTLPPVIEVISIKQAERIRDYIKTYKNMSAGLVHCLSEYETYLDTINNWLTAIKFPDFKYSDSLNTYSQTEDLEDYIRWFQTLESNYLNGTTNKFDLISQYQSEKSLGVVTNMETLRTRIQQAVSIPIKTAIADIERIMGEYYGLGLQLLLRLSGYFVDKQGEILSPARNLSLWRQPYASFDNPDILDFHLREEEGRRSVPVYLVSYIESDSKDDVTAYLANYFTALAEVINEIDAEILSLIKHLQTSIDTLNRDLADFEEETDVGKEFVR